VHHAITQLRAAAASNGRRINGEAEDLDFVGLVLRRKRRRLLLLAALLHFTCSLAAGIPGVSRVGKGNDQRYGHERQEAAEKIAMLWVGRHRDTLALAAAHANIERHYAKLVAHGDQRNRAIEVVLHLDNLLRRLRYVGDVGDGDFVDTCCSMVTRAPGLLVAPPTSGEI